MKIYIALIVASIISMVSCAEDKYRPETLYNPEQEKTSSVQNITVIDLTNNSTGTGPVIYVDYFIRKQVLKEDAKKIDYSLKGNCHINGLDTSVYDKTTKRNI